MVAEQINRIIQHIANNFLIKIVFASVVATLSVSKAFRTTAFETLSASKKPISAYLKYLPRFGIVARSA